MRKILAVLFLLFAAGCTSVRYGSKDKDGVFVDSRTTAAGGAALIHAATGNEAINKGIEAGVPVYVYDPATGHPVAAVGGRYEILVTDPGTYAPDPFLSAAANATLRQRLKQDEERIGNLENARDVAVEAIKAAAKNETEAKTE